MPNFATPHPEEMEDRRSWIIPPLPVLCLQVLCLLLPLNTRWWLGRDIIQHAVDAFDFVQNPVAGFA